MAQEKKVMALFPGIQNVFLTRVVLMFLSPCEILSTINLLNRAGHFVAMDCSIWKTIIYGKTKYAMSYDCHDYFDFFLRNLERGEQLTKLDFHYYFRGEELSKSILIQLRKFPNLNDLRFGESVFTTENYDLFQQLKLNKCRHMTAPLLSKKQDAQKFLQILKEVAPNLESLTFEDPSYENCSCTQLVAINLKEFNLKALRLKIHENSTRETMGGIKTHLYPSLSSIYIRNLVPEKDEHRELLNSLLSENEVMQMVKLKCDGAISPFEINWNISTLQELFVYRLTSHYKSLSHFVEQNTNIRKYVQKHPTQTQNCHPPASFALFNLLQLHHLSLGGEFKDVVLENLPQLTYLSLKCNWARIKLKSWNYRRLNLIKLKTVHDHQAKIFIDVDLALDFDSVHTASFKRVQILFKQPFPNIFSLHSSDPQLLFRHAHLGLLRRVTYLYPPSVPQYIEEMLPKFLQFPQLAYLQLDALSVTEKSLGSILVNFARLTSLVLRCVDKADSDIIITNQCTSLTHFELRGTLEKEVQIHAPNIQSIYIEGLKTYKKLVISAQTGYLLHLHNTVVHLEECPGMGKLVLEYNWSSETERLTAEFTTKNFYPKLQAISCRNLQQYSNRFFHSFAQTAANLSELYICFAEGVRLEDEANGDNVILLNHPNVKWITLMRGEEFFREIRITKACKNLQLLKFRDFELKTFVNEAGARFWSEKNLVNDEDF